METQWRAQDPEKPWMMYYSTGATHAPHHVFAEISEAPDGTLTHRFLVAPFQVAAEKRVRAFLLLNEVARQNKINVDQRRVADMLASIASTYEEPEKVVELYSKDAELMSSLRNSVLEDQVVDWIADHAKVSDEKLSFDQLMKPQG